MAPEAVEPEPEVLETAALDIVHGHAGHAGLVLDQLGAGEHFLPGAGHAGACLGVEVLAIEEQLRMRAHRQAVIAAGVDGGRTENLGVAREIQGIGLDHGIDRLEVAGQRRQPAVLVGDDVIGAVAGHRLGRDLVQQLAVGNVAVDDLDSGELLEFGEAFFLRPELRGRRQQHVDGLAGKRLVGLQGVGEGGLRQRRKARRVRNGGSACCLDEVPSFQLGPLVVCEAEWPVLERQELPMHSDALWATCIRMQSPDKP